MEYYSSIKENEIMSFAERWMEMESAMLSEKSQNKKDKECRIFSHMWSLGLIYLSI
jgi:hypothetical protein